MSNSKKIGAPAWIHSKGDGTVDEPDVANSLLSLCNQLDHLGFILLAASDSRDIPLEGEDVGAFANMIQQRAQEMHNLVEYWCHIKHKERMAVVKDAES